MPTDAEILDWLERMHTLHKSVEVLYVVEGYEVTVCYDHQPVGESYYAETLREAYASAMRNSNV